MPTRARLLPGLLIPCLFLCCAIRPDAAPFDAAPFALPLPEGNGLLWEDPREIHRVVVRFQGAAPAPDKLRLEYWGSWWPERHLPKDREPGGGDVGWMELGHWYRYGWRTADTEIRADASSVEFSFRPVNAREYPKLADYPAPFRYTLKIRVVADGPTPPIERIQAFTDSELAPRTLRLAFAKPAGPRIEATAYNGRVERTETLSPTFTRLQLQMVTNSDPNTFDRTLVTITRGSDVFTFKVDDLQSGPLFLPQWGVAVVEDVDILDYSMVQTIVDRQGRKSFYDRVRELPEQTWTNAWAGMPPKKSRIHFPLGLDGGRQRFRLEPDGGVFFRSNDGYLRARPGRDTPRLDLEKGPVAVRFGLPAQPVDRTLAEETLPVCLAAWEQDGLRIEQAAFVTPLDGMRAAGPAPEPDAVTVFVARFSVTNATAAARSLVLPLEYRPAGDAPPTLRADDAGRLWLGDHLRAVVTGDVLPSVQEGRLAWNMEIPAGGRREWVVRLPYVCLTEPAEQAALARLDFATEQRAVTTWWRRRLNEGTRLLTPEPMLNEFFRAHASHLLINCEREPGAERRFARVGSFSYGAYGNESCMMVVDLDRRGYHREARECLDAWLHYQGTVPLPGDFAGQEGVLYGAGGYESGGYNQHHGWILWTLAEHYRFSRDRPWLERAAPGILQGADWILRETGRTAGRHELERGLLPAGSLEDIGDWWTWLSTSCYTWRGLDAAAWALEQVQHPEAGRIRRGAREYHAALLRNFTASSRRSPVVRLRDGSAVPQFPSHVHRRGRTFGWITQTLEGALHLLITRTLDPNSTEAGWILRDYEDNLYLSNQYGYTLDDLEAHWFSRGGMSMQACLLLGVEPYLYRDDIPHALRALFNGMAVSYFPDVRMNTEHALPNLGDWRGDHFKTSDEANAAGWLRQLFVREEGNQLWIGQGLPRAWLEAGERIAIERAATHFGPVSVTYLGSDGRARARLEGPKRNPPAALRVRFREPKARPIVSATVNGKEWKDFQGDWVNLPGTIGNAEVEVGF